MKKLSFFLLSVVAVALIGHTFITDTSTDAVVYEDRIVRNSSQEFGTNIFLPGPNLPAENLNHSAPDPWVYEAVKMQMVDVSNAYKENIRYPTYSKPLHENDWAQLNPRPFIAKEIPMGFDESISASIVLDHYIVNLGEDLPVSVKVTGDAKVSEILVFLQNDTDKKNAISLSKTTSDKTSVVYSGIIPSSTLADYQESEILILSDISFLNSETAKVSAVFKLVGTDATLLKLGASYVEEANLVIPAEFDVLVSGYYRVEANLFDQTTGQPISHLNSAFLLTRRENSGLIKVHSSTLRSKGSQGPYLMTDFNITRGPAKPSDKTGYGVSKEDSYEVKGFDLSFYNEEAYVDPQNQRRLEFLQKMAGVN